MSTETKVCKKCQLEQPITSFWVTDKKRGYLRNSCKECDRALARAYYAKTPAYREAVRANSRKQEAKLRQFHPEKLKGMRRKAALKGNYGLTPDQYDALRESQGNCCALCRVETCGRTNGKWSAGHWMVDHDHKTGRVRGLLCHKCNVRIGAYEGLMKEVGAARLLAYLSPEFEKESNAKFLAYLSQGSEKDSPP